MVAVVYNILPRAEKIIKSVASNVLILMYVFSILQDKFSDIYMFTVNVWNLEIQCFFVESIIEINFPDWNRQAAITVLSTPKTK